MHLGLDGRVALVAASSRGLGRAVAEELAREGCDLVLCARSAGPLDEARAHIAGETGRKVVARPTDVADAAEVEALVALAHETFGKVDILVTNGGGPPPGTFDDHGLDAWRAGDGPRLAQLVGRCTHALFECGIVNVADDNIVYIYRLFA